MPNEKNRVRAKKGLRPLKDEKVWDDSMVTGDGVTVDEGALVWVWVRNESGVFNLLSGEVGHIRHGHDWARVFLCGVEKSFHGFYEMKRNLIYSSEAAAITARIKSLEQETRLLMARLAALEKDA